MQRTNRLKNTWAGGLVLSALLLSGCLSKSSYWVVYVNEKDSTQTLTLVSQPTMKAHVIKMFHDTTAVSGEYTLKTGSETSSGTYS